jgi:hypothetical protein
MRLWGLVSWIADNLTRYRFARVPVAWWLVGIAGGWIALLLLGHAQPTPAAIAAVVIAAVLLLAAGLGSRNRSVVFRPAELAPPLPARPLAPEEKIPVRAAGFLQVSGMRKHFANVQAWFETVETREHILIARNPCSRFLLIAQTREHESGMWYAFFRPEHIRSVETGLACFGWRIRPALRIAFQPEDRKAEDRLVLSFDSLENLSAVLDDVRGDAAIER